MSSQSGSFSSQGDWCSSSAKLDVHRPKRAVVPSKFKLSPYVMPLARIRVSRLEADVYDVVLQMAEISDLSE